MANSNRIKKLSKDLLIDIIQDISNIFISNILNQSASLAYSSAASNSTSATAAAANSNQELGSGVSLAAEINNTTAAAALSSATVFLPLIGAGGSSLCQPQQTAPASGTHSPSSQGSHSPFSQRNNLELFLFANNKQQGGGGGGDTAKN